MQNDSARRPLRANPRVGARCAMVLLTALAMALAGCAANRATDSGHVDHNLDLPYWEQ